MTATVSPIPGLHLVRYGVAADQHYLVNEFLETYDQLVINANMLAHMPAALASFLTQRAKRKPYFIDPQTHAFQHDIAFLQSSSERRAGKIKRSIATLIDEYGEPVNRIMQEEPEPVLPEHFREDTKRRQFCERVIRYQWNVISRQLQESDVAKYYRFLQISGDFRPSLVISPYFFLSPNTFRQWLDVNLNCARDSSDVARRLGAPLGVQIVLSRELLASPALLKRLVGGYSKGVKPAAFLVWVDSFSEQGASKEQLEAFVKLLRDLGSEGASVVNLYGGFFSVALRQTGMVTQLAGVVHGLEYGEERPVVPVGGGFPVPKFYLPALHTRLPFRDALRAVRALRGLESADRFHECVCACRECRSVVREDPQTEFAEYGRTRPIVVERPALTVREYPLPETKQHCVRHYMWSKNTEYQANAPDSIPKDLKEAGKTLERALGLDAVAHCGVWAEVLSPA